MEQLHYTFKAEKTMQINDMVFPLDEEFSIQNNRGSQYWHVLQDGKISGEVTTSILQKELIGTAGKRGLNVSMPDKTQAESYFHAVKFADFPLKPNQYLGNIIERYLTKGEYEEEDEKSKDNSPSVHKLLPRGVHKTKQPLWISGPVGGIDGTNPDDPIAALREAHAVYLTDFAWEHAVGSMLDGFTYYFSVVELDDRYRFYLKYNEIIGSRSICENYKGEIWNQ